MCVELPLGCIGHALGRNLASALEKQRGEALEAVDVELIAQALRRVHKLAQLLLSHLGSRHAAESAKEPSLEVRPGRRRFGKGHEPPQPVFGQRCSSGVYTMSVTIAGSDTQRGLARGEVMLGLLHPFSCGHAGGVSPSGEARQSAQRREREQLLRHRSGMLLRLLHKVHERLLLRLRLLMQLMEEVHHLLLRIDGRGDRGAACGSVRMPGDGVLGHRNGRAMLQHNERADLECAVRRDDVSGSESATEVRDRG